MNPMAGVENVTAMDNVESVNKGVSDNTWKAISLTFVEYQAGDILGYILAWSSLLPIFIFILFATLIIFRRDLHTMSFLCGLLLNEAFNWVLKHIIRDARPPRDFKVLYTEYGMPSSHSQFMWFLAAYLVLFLFIRIYQNYNLIDELWKYVVSLLVFIAATIVAVSRVYLGYHTTGQVIWGSVIGLSLGLLWFSFVQLVLTPFFPIIASQFLPNMVVFKMSPYRIHHKIGLEINKLGLKKEWKKYGIAFYSPLGEFLMVRDSTLIPHVMWFEYTSTRNESRSRQRKITSRKSQ